MKDYKYFIDTNIFLRVLTKDNEASFNKCVKFLDDLKKGKYKAYTSNLVLAEINWTLGSFYKFPKNKVILAIDSILNLKNLKIIDDFNIKIALINYKKYSVKFIDALLASNNKIISKEVKIVSFDKDFDNLKVGRIEP